MKRHMAMAINLFHWMYDRVRGTSARLSGEILTSADELEQILERIEPHFLLLGNLFQEAQAGTGRFIKEVVLSIETIQGGEDQTGLTGVKDLAKGFVDRLNDHRQAIAQSVSNFDQVIRNLTLLPRSCEKAYRVALLLRVIALNIGIESQGLANDKDVFKAFVEEVYALSGHMKGVADSLSEDSIRLQKKHSRTMSDVEGNVAALYGLSKDAQKDMDVSSVHVHQLMETALVSMETVRKTMQHIAKKAGDIVVALQFHDIIRQKTEHMVSALREAVSWMEQGPLIRDEANHKKKVKSLLMIQLGQIEEILKEISDAHQSISQALQGLDGDVGDIYRHIVSLGARTGRAKVESPFYALMASMGSLEAIKGQALELEGRVQQYMKDASTEASALTGHIDAVEQIRLDLHRKALNAIVKAAHLGDRGQGIEVLAQEVNKASLATRVFAEEVVAVVENVCVKTGELRRAELMGEDVHGMDQDTFSKGLASLSRAYEAFEQHIEDMTGHFEGIEDVLSRGRDSLIFLEDFSSDIKRVQEAIYHASECIIPSSRADAETIVETAGEHRYTMDSERRVHEQVLGFVDTEKSESVSDDSPVDENPEDDEDSFGDNVELF